MEVPQKTKKRVTIWSQLSIGNISGHNVMWKDTYTPMFITALFTVAKT